MRYDVFISHASEDKDDFVRPLAAELTRLGLSVWYDESSLKLGDSIRQKIDEGLSASDYGVVVLSKSFVAKNWTHAELDGLFVREMNGRKVILPVWHKMTKDEVLRCSPLLAGKLAALSEEGVGPVASKIYAVIRPSIDSALSGFRSFETRTKVVPVSGGPLTELLRSLHDVAPLLHKLDELVEGRDALRMLSAMQRFFYGANLLTLELDKDLKFATDNMLRVLSVDQSDLHYRYSKLGAARGRFEAFRAAMNVSYEMPPVDAREDIRVAFRSLNAGLLNIVQEGKSIRETDILLLRLNVTIAEYGTLLEKKKPYPKLSTHFHHSLRELLTRLVTIGLNVEFPDPLDRISAGDIKAYCSALWEKYED